MKPHTALMCVCLLSLCIPATATQARAHAPSSNNDLSGVESGHRGVRQARQQDPAKRNYFLRLVALNNIRITQAEVDRMTNAELEAATLQLLAGPQASTQKPGGSLRPPPPPPRPLNPVLRSSAVPRPLLATATRPPPPLGPPPSALTPRPSQPVQTPLRPTRFNLPGTTQPPVPPPTYTPTLAPPLTRRPPTTTLSSPPNQVLSTAMVPPKAPMLTPISTAAVPPTAPMVTPTSAITPFTTINMVPTTNLVVTPTFTAMVPTTNLFVFSSDAPTTNLVDSTFDPIDIDFIDDNGAILLDDEDPFVTLGLSTTMRASSVKRTGTTLIKKTPTTTTIKETTTRTPTPTTTRTIAPDKTNTVPQGIKFYLPMTRSCLVTIDPLVTTGPCSSPNVTLVNFDPTQGVLLPAGYENLVTPSGDCLGVLGDVASAGSKVAVVPCNSRSKLQKWRVTGNGQQLQNGQAGLCVDVQRNKNDPDTRILAYLQPCASPPAGTQLLKPQYPGSAINNNRPKPQPAPDQPSSFVPANDGPATDVKNIGQHKCLGTNARSEVVLLDCNDPGLISISPIGQSAASVQAIVDGNLDTKRCLGAVPGQGVAAGSLIGLVNCAAGAALSFKWRGSYQVQNTNGTLCWGFVQQGVELKLNLQPCDNSGSNRNQHFALMAPYVPIVSGRGNACLVFARTQNTQSPQPVYFKDCFNKNVLSARLDDAARVIRTDTGSCLGTVSDQVTEGVTLALRPCEGQQSTYWRFIKNGNQLQTNPTDKTLPVLCVSRDPRTTRAFLEKCNAAASAGQSLGPQWVTMGSGFA